MGIDLGSISLNIVIIDTAAQIKVSIYERTQGRPLAVLLGCLEKLSLQFHVIDGIIATGSGRKLVSNTLKVPDINEITTQATAACHLYPNVRTIVEIGGQDSKLIFIDRDSETGKPIVTDHVLNDVCAAGTGSFLDLQAHRLGMTVEEIGAMALCSKHPARISGRCSVFAKTDMVHLLQEGTPKPDILAGLCNALALNFITNLGKGKAFPEPIVFQGGVAANPGVVDALEKHLVLESGSLIIPDKFLVMGAFGSALMACTQTHPSPQPVTTLIESVRDGLKRSQYHHRTTHLKPLVPRKDCRDAAGDDYYEIEGRDGDNIEVFLGIDVGAVSTNIVLTDKRGKVVAKQYWYTQGEPAGTVRTGLQAMAEKMGNSISVCGVGVTGSGRYFIGDFVGADVVINEITAQARAAVHLDPDVDTVIEIGGQDSKFIRCKDGRVTDFEMNKVCAAGTGSFLEEQAERLKVPIGKCFSDLALSSSAPANLGARCTVFMESDLIHHQQTGEGLDDLTAGLSYAVAYNYLEKVVGTKKIGHRIRFQGGVAANDSVATAFENVLDKPLTISKHHNVTGALGAALVARDRRPTSSCFAGFYLKDRSYKVRTFDCEKCPNRCRIHQVYVKGSLRSYYGSLCGRYEKHSDHSLQTVLPDLFSERERHLMDGFDEKKSLAQGTGQVIGIPRALSFFDYFPFWKTFFEVLNHPIVLSEKTNKNLVQSGLSRVPSETCFPIKTVYGHLKDLISKGVDHILLPCEIDHRLTNDTGLRSFNCPYMQSIPYMAQATMGASKVRLLSPIIRWRNSDRAVNHVLVNLGKSLGHSAKKTRQALAAAREAQKNFDMWRQNRGKEVMASLQPGDRCLALLGKAYNIFDPGLNLHLARKLARQGQLTIPFDMLPVKHVHLPSEYDNVVWKNTRNLIKAVILLRNDQHLFPVLLTNFGCGPDSFLMKYMEVELPDKPYLVLEVDDHTGDAGMATRIEAFLEMLDATPKEPETDRHPLNLVIRGRQRSVDAWNPRAKILRSLENRTLYFPYVSSGFSTVIKAAFEAIGFKAEILPEPDDESEYLGRQFTSGRECHPFIVTCGDFLKLTRKPDFDPERAAILMQNYDGACRFSQYGIGHADLFRRLGLHQVLVIAPLTSTRFDEFSGIFGLHFTKRLWEGWLASEVLERIRLHVRPYERSPGQTDRLFLSGIQDVARAVAQGDGRRSIWNREVLSALKRAVTTLLGIPVDRPWRRPVVGIVGEFYTVLNRWANQDLIRTLERLGVEVTIHGLTVPNFYTLFSEHYYSRNRLRMGKPGSAFYYLLRNQWVMSWVRQVEAALPDQLRPFGTLSAKEMISQSEPFIHHDIDPVLTILTTRVRRFAASGISGICNLYVLNCMLGNVSVPIFKNALRTHENLPVLHAVYDGQRETNMLTRVEAFVHQAKLYQEQYGGWKPSPS